MHDHLVANYCNFETFQNSSGIMKPCSLKSCDFSLIRALNHGSKQIIQKGFKALQSSVSLHQLSIFSAV